MRDQGQCSNIVNIIMNCIYICSWLLHGREVPGTAERVMHAQWGEQGNWEKGVNSSGVTTPGQLWSMTRLPF